MAVTKELSWVEFKMVPALGKAHVHFLSSPPLRSFPDVAFEMVLVFVWLMVARSLPFEEDGLESMLWIVVLSSF